MWIHYTFSDWENVDFMFGGSHYEKNDVKFDQWTDKSNEHSSVNLDSHHFNSNKNLHWNGKKTFAENGRQMYQTKYSQGSCLLKGGSTKALRMYWTG